MDTNTLSSGKAIQSRMQVGNLLPILKEEEKKFLKNTEITIHYNLWRHIKGLAFKWLPFRILSSNTITTIMPNQLNQPLPPSTTRMCFSIVDYDSTASSSPRPVSPLFENLEPWTEGELQTPLFLRDTLEAVERGDHDDIYATPDPKPPSDSVPSLVSTGWSDPYSSPPLFTPQPTPNIWKCNGLTAEELLDWTKWPEDLQEVVQALKDGWHQPSPDTFRHWAYIANLVKDKEDELVILRCTAGTLFWKLKNDGIEDKLDFFMARKRWSPEETKSEWEANLNNNNNNATTYVDNIVHNLARPRRETSGNIKLIGSIGPLYSDIIAKAGHQ